MDIDLRWGGDPSIVLAVQALVASIPIQVSISTYCHNLYILEPWLSISYSILQMYDASSN